jgi:hypothetical protein
MLCAPIENIIYQSINEMVEGRRRVVVPLEVEPARDGEAVDGDILIRVLSCSGLPSGSELNRFQVTARNANLQVARRSRVRADPFRSRNHAFATVHWFAIYFICFMHLICK